MPLDAVSLDISLYRWRLGFRQYSFRLIMRTLRNDPYGVFWCLPLFWSAIVPFGFRHQVNQLVQEFFSEFFLIPSGIQYHVPRRTDPADCALVHAKGSGKVPHPLAPRQSQTDLADLSIPNLHTRMAIPSQFPAVPQAISRITGMIAEIEVLRPVVSRVVVPMTDEFIGAKLPP